MHKSCSCFTSLTSLTFVAAVIRKEVADCEANNDADADTDADADADACDGGENLCRSGRISEV